MLRETVSLGWLGVGLPFNAQVLKKESSGAPDSSKQQDIQDELKIDDSNFDEVCLSPSLCFGHFWLHSLLVCRVWSGIEMRMLTMW